MSVTIVDNDGTGPSLTTIHECDAASIGTWDSVNTDLERESTGCLSLKLGTDSDGGTVDLTSVNMTGKRMWAWGLVNHALDTQANGGFAIQVTDTGGDGRRYHVGGKDNMGYQVLGWSCVVLDFDNYPAVYTDTPGDEPDKTAVQYVGLYVKALAKAYGVADNSYTDIWRYGTGYMVTAGGSGTDGTFKEIADEDIKTDDGYAWGITREIQTNVYGVQGMLGFGDTGTSDSYFLDDAGSVVVFEDHELGSGAYDVSLYGNSTGFNAFTLGEKPAGDGINGVTFISASEVSRCTFDFSDTDFNVVKLYGCTWQNCGTIIMPSGGSGKEVKTCTFTRCDRITVSSVPMQDCTFVAASGANALKGAVLMGLDHNMSDCIFIGNDKAVHINTSGTYTFDNLTFSGNTTDINNTSGGKVIINATNGANPSTYTGDVTILNSVDITVHVEDVNRTNIENAAVSIEEYGNPDNVIMNEFTDVDGDAEATYNYTSDLDILIKVRKSSSGATRYFPVRTTGSIGSTGFSLTVVLQADAIAAT